MFFKDLYYYCLIMKSGLFDLTYYLLKYPDIRHADMDPLWHYIKFGWREGRNPLPEFETNYYLGNNEDVFKENINPLIHFLKIGWKEGRNPNPNFSCNFYIETYKDVKLSRMNPLVHYIKFGKKENRFPCKDCLSATNGHFENLVDTDFDNLKPVYNGFIFLIYETNDVCTSIDLLNLCKTYKQYYGDNIIILSVGRGLFFEDFKKAIKTFYLDRSVIDSSIDKSIEDIFVRLHQLGYRNCVANNVLTGVLVDIMHTLGFNSLFLIHELPHTHDNLKFTRSALNIAKSHKEVVFTSSIVAEQFISTYKLPREYSHVVQQGVLSSTIIPSSKIEANEKLLEKLEIKNQQNAKILLGIGETQNVEGTELFLEVAHEVFRLNLMDNLHLLLMGKRDEVLNLLKNKANPNLPYKSNIHFLDIEPVPAYVFAGADLFLITSSLKSFPSAALEALTNQTPVIMLKNNGDFGEIKNCFNGCVIPNHDPKKIAHKIIQFLKENSLTKPFKENINSYLDYLNEISAIFDDIQKKSLLNPIVSVVIPVYDRTDLLVSSIESILNQSYQNFELILVCDGSPPETLEIVKHYDMNHEKVRAFYFKNNSGNAIRGRNKGIKEARGKYIAFQDSDDMAEPDRLKYSLEIIQNFEVDIVYGGWRAIVDGSRDIDIVDGTEIFSPEFDFETLKLINVPCQSTVMAKLQAIRDVGGFNLKMKYREDHELWLRMVYRGYKFKAIDKIVTNLRLHKGNLEISYKPSDDVWYSQMLEEYSKEIKLPAKIGYVIPGTGISGGIAIVCEHVNRLIKRGYDVSIITEDKESDIPWFPGLLAEVIPISDCENNYDVLVATGWSTAYNVLKIPSKRKFYFVQSDESRFFSEDDPSHGLALATYTFDFEFITIAHWLQNWLLDKFEKDSIYVPNGINFEITHQVDPLVPKGEKVRILLEGPIDIPFKGMEDAFAAVKDLDCEVWCVSTLGKPKPEWKCDRFFYQIPFGEMKSIYSSCDILLKMSRVEGCPLPPLEMMACGGTVVLGEVTGIEEYAKNYHNAIIVGKGDIIGARDALTELMDNKELLEKLKVNGKKTVENFLWEKTIDVLENTYIL